MFPTSRHRVTRPAPGLVAVGILLVLAACGSQVDPATVARVNGSSLAGAQGGVVPAGQSVDGSAPGSGTDAGAGAPAPAAAADGAESGTGGAGGSPASGATGGPRGSGNQAADGGGTAGSCAGFHNQTGITDSTITIANVSDISGPVPGIFAAAQEATRAYAAYFNATGDLCGRKLAVELLDSRADSGADQQAYAKACADAFATVGSMSAFDAGGARTAQDCGIPDLRSTTVNPERAKCTTCFAAQSVSPNLVPSAMPRYWLEQQPEATQHMALFYINAGAAPVNAQSFRVAWEKAGWQVDVFSGIDVSEFNYSPYVQQMKDKGSQMVMYIGPYQNTEKLQAAMKQQGFEPKVYQQDSTIYDQNYVDESGSAADGTFVYSTIELLDDLSNPEMALYRSWLDQVKPGAVPNFYGLYAWSAARLFVEQAAALGGRLDRANLVNALSKVRNWTGNGLHAPQQVGAKTTANCVKILRLNGGKWSQVSPGNYMCGPLINTGIGD